MSAMLRIRNVESCVATPCGLVGCSDVSENHTTSVFRVDVKEATLHISKLKFGSIQYIFKKKISRQFLYSDRALFRPKVTS